MSRAVAAGSAARLLAGACLLGSIACSGNDPALERSAESLCTRWDQLVDDVGSGTELAEGSEGPALLRELANRSPDPELTDVLEQLADLQPEWRRQVDAIESAETANEVDSDLLVRFGAASLEMLDGIHRVCD